MCKKLEGVSVILHFGSPFGRYYFKVSMFEGCSVHMISFAVVYPFTTLLLCCIFFLEFLLLTVGKWMT